MKKISNYSKIEVFVLVVLRLVIGYHFLEEGVNKLLNPNWNSAPFLLQSNWIFSDFFHNLVNNQVLLPLVNYLNIYGQILIGLSLILGMFSSVAAVIGALLILSYYVTFPPFVEGYTFIDKNLFEFFAFLITALFPTSYIIGLDSLIGKFRGIKSEK